MSTEDEIKELYYRKAETRNENITVRNYIPQNFHARFMFLSSVCAEKRVENPLLKTQLRFGRKDVEVYCKIKGEEEGFRKIELSDFTDEEKIPTFNHSIKWKRYDDKPPRRRLTSHKEVTALRPSLNNQQGKENLSKPATAGKTTEATSLTRANSNSISNARKRQKV